MSVLDFLHLHSALNRWRFTKKSRSKLSTPFPLATTPFHASQMSTLNTPVTGEGTPLSAFSVSNLATPESSRLTNVGSPSPFPSTSRRTGGHSSQLLSMYSNQDRVILDIGARFLRAGFSGEAFPRCTIDAIDKTDHEIFWEDQNWEPGLIEDRLEHGLREVYSQHVSP